MISEDMRYKMMRLLDANPGMSQRDAARDIGVSLGRVNYCVQALMRKGWLKASRFKNSRRKAAYTYLLTPRGIEEKSKLTLVFLHIKLREYRDLHAEIEQIRRDVERQV